MRFTLWALAALTPWLVPAAIAEEATEQAARDAVVEIIQKSLGGDAEGIGKRLHDELIVADVMTGIVGKDGVLERVKNQPQQQTFEVGAVDVSAHGHVAYFIATVDGKATQTADLTVQFVGTVAFDDDRWQLANAVTLLVPGEDPQIPPEMKEALADQTEAVEVLIAQFDEWALQNDLESFFSKCAPETVFAGPYGEGGALAFHDVDEMRAFQDAHDMTDISIELADDGLRWDIVGARAAAMHRAYLIKHQGNPIMKLYSLALLFWTEDDGWRVFGGADGIAAP